MESMSSVRWTKKVRTLARIDLRRIWVTVQSDFCDLPRRFARVLPALWVRPVARRLALLSIIGTLSACAAFQRRTSSIAALRQVTGRRWRGEVDG